jgi:drug/metabolite transporter (DMT)-like permease
MAASAIGVWWMVAAMFCFSLTYGLFKACLPYMSNIQILCFQSIVSWLLILPFALKGGWQGLKSEKVKLIALRALLGIGSMYLITLALRTIPLAETIVLNNTAPLFVPFIVFFSLKEKINHRLWAGLVIGFLGVIVMLHPGIGVLNGGLIWALISGMFGGGLLVVSRLIAGEPFLRLMFYFFLFIILFTAPFAWMSGGMPAPIGWVYIVLAGFTTIGSFVLLTGAMRYAGSQEVAPFVYTGVLFSGLIDWVVWGDRPSALALIGMAIVCLGGILILVMNRKKAL